ncbi:MAG: hypothetical protein HYT37_04070 [Candidatus Sungbacteria bacterium]|nr:hypothetical protein [Candidatus Sungbacteria bacterium]
MNMIEIVLARNLFETQEFLNSPYVAKFCATMRRVWLTNAVLPPGHFGSYFECTSRRSGVYANPYIHDLYILHELLHIHEFRQSGYSPAWSWLDWALYINTIEFEVAIMTDCMIYFIIPGLREKTFSHEIWVDEYLGLLGKPIQYITARIREERFKAYNNPDPRNILAQQIRAYAEQNMKWCQIWAKPVGYGPYAEKPAFRVVEEHRPRIAFLQHHIRWLADVSEPKSGTPFVGLDGIPFARQAEKFQKVFEENKKWFGNEVLLA